MLLAISPYTHRGVIDSTMYNQSSVMRTMELILGLRPMTHFDAAGASADGRVRGNAEPGAVHGGEAAHFADRAKSAGVVHGGAVRAYGF